MSPRRSYSLRLSLAYPSIRAAAAEFVRGTTLGWGRRELASWLLCHYSPCLVSDATVHPDGYAASAALSSAPSRVVLDDERVERLVHDARSSVLRSLADLAWPSQARTIAEAAIRAGSVIETRDGPDAWSWAPLGRRRMGLAERVGSLFIADALNAPEDYRNVSMCRECGDLGFSAAIPHTTWCERARRVA